ncbi:DUF2521 family protein [Pontibacillus litoralis]|uniref:DUF2521 family protein n=1 Tax=Pontibacillus litoralis JSM 072002 TaxID=1385512 RepID=A0A0A5HL67_9BACI|nr:DUF2521 family protein [Pontibacillus litoralis]KGX84372.1 hypothetical protein N784_13630 [Pontibacillus litoralis JSM 072002]
MTVVPLDQVRLNKQMRFERNLLRELILEEVHQDVEVSFRFWFHSYYVYDTAIREEALEQAMEAFLLGAEASILKCNGQSEGAIREQYSEELSSMAEDFYDYLDYWQEATSRHGWFHIRAKDTCSAFFYRWWELGLKKGERRKRLRLD